MEPASPLPDLSSPNSPGENFERGLAELVRLLARQAAAEHHRQTRPGSNLAEDT